MAITATIKRSKAAQLLDRTPRTLVRWEDEGILTPIKLNCRSTVYAMAQVQKLLEGNIATSAGESQPTAPPRGPTGTFRTLPGGKAAKALSRSRSLPQ